MAAAEPSTANILPAGKRPELVREAWIASLPLRPVKRTRVIALHGLDNTPNHVKNSRGDTIRIDLPPIKPCGDASNSSCQSSDGSSWAEYGLSLAMRLYMHFLAEGAFMFALMFLVSIATLYDNVLRSNLRSCCREAAGTADGYAALVHGIFNSSDSGPGTRSLSSSSSGGTGGFVERCGTFEELSMQCGYSNLPIRPFDSAMLLGSYASSTSPYMLWTAIGTCTEYAAAATTRTHCQQCPSFSLSLPV